jgi:hypothetical protein
MIFYSSIQELKHCHCYTYAYCLPSINSRFALTFLMIPGGVDVLGTLSEKLNQLTNEAKDHHSSFSDLTKLYKEDKIKDGLRHNKYGDIQKYNCRDCNRYFTIKVGFERIHASLIWP